ncbi:MAG TPA: hypothetical protein VHV47_09305 [Opitutaceae bacterium]|jgi:hypothetical protein|nr:hypothetical protein [Opitutaceae bacterium]
MKISRLGSALSFAPLLVCGFLRPLSAADAPAPGGVEKQALQAGVYRMPVTAPATATPAATPATPVTFLPAFQVIAPTDWLSDRLYYQLKAQLAWNADQPRALIFREFAYGPSIRAFETPKLGEVDVPWSPMVIDEPVLSTDYPNYVSNKLQVRFPLVNVVW